MLKCQRLMYELITVIMDKCMFGVKSIIHLSHNTHIIHIKGGGYGGGVKGGTLQRGGEEIASSVLTADPASNVS